MSAGGGWIGVDLDGTLAYYERWNGGVIGPPIPRMLDRVKEWIRAGRRVKIFTARVAHDPDHSQEHAVLRWCCEHIGVPLEVTAVKDFEMIELWDDRCVQVVPNTGEPVVKPKKRGGRPLGS